MRNLLSLLCVVLLAGCVERRMHIVSDPPGAQIFVDGQKLGVTPGKIVFDFYGTREVVLYKQGCRPVQRMEKLSPPWYQVFPLDFLFELCWPFTLHDEHQLDYALTPSQPLSSGQQEELVERAKQLRDRAWEHGKE